MASTGRPQIPATRSGRDSRMRARNASQPACARDEVPVLRALGEHDVHEPSASAASVPGIGARCSSAASAVRVRIGSITTSRACRRAAEIAAPEVGVRT